MPTIPVSAGTLTLSANRDWSPIPNEDVYLECNTSVGAITINLPVISGWSTRKNVKFYVTDVSGNAGANPITINTTNGQNFINGGSQVVINTNYGQGFIIITNSTNYLYLTSSDAFETVETTLEDVDGTFALPLLYVPSEGEVVNIFTQLKAVSDSGKIYSISMTRTILGIAGDPPGAIVPVGNAVLVTNPPQTLGGPTFNVDFGETNNTGFIQFVSVSGEGNIVVTIKESYL